MISLTEMDAGMDTRLFTFALDIPPDFERDVLSGRSPVIQLNVDATRMSQAFTGSGYIQQITLGQINEFVQRYRSAAVPPVDLALRARFNPALTPAWFGSIMEIVLISVIHVCSVILAVQRLSVYGVKAYMVEHLLVMPLNTRSK